MNKKTEVLAELNKVSNHLPSNWLPAKVIERDYVDGEGNKCHAVYFELVTPIEDSGKRLYTLSQYKNLLVEYNKTR